MFDAKALLEQISNQVQRPSASRRPPSRRRRRRPFQHLRTDRGRRAGPVGPRRRQPRPDPHQLKEQATKYGGTELVDTLTKAFGQATQGVREGATKISDATGAREAVTNATAASRRKNSSPRSKT